MRFRLSRKSPSNPDEIRCEDESSPRQTFTATPKSDPILALLPLRYGTLRDLSRGGNKLLPAGALPTLVLNGAAKPRNQGWEGDAG